MMRNVCHVHRVPLLIYFQHYFVHASYILDTKEERIYWFLNLLKNLHDQELYRWFLFTSIEMVVYSHTFERYFILENPPSKTFPISYVVSFHTWQIIHVDKMILQQKLIPQEYFTHTLLLFYLSLMDSRDYDHHTPRQHKHRHSWPANLQEQ